MTVKRKRLVYLASGFFLFVVCGSFVWLGYLFSWGLAFAEPRNYLKFVIHPATLLFILSFWLLYRGFMVRER